jgi:hypothetical protein
MSFVGSAMKIIVLAALAGALATPALAARSDAQPGAQPDAKAKKPHLICKRDGSSTGSHMEKSVCKTAAEWAGTSVEADRNKLDNVTHD